MSDISINGRKNDNSDSLGNKGFELPNDRAHDLGKSKSKEKIHHHVLKSEPSEEAVDPRVQVELEKLNTATDLINKLEIELDDARANFRLLLTESSQRINQMATKLGGCIDRARPYYEARMSAKELQQETQRAALKFERASSAHAAAKEMVRLSEEGLCKEGRTFDPAWQEMLNHATMKVNEAEHERRTSKAAHQKMSQAYNAAEQSVQQLHVQLKKSIVKSSLSTRRSLLQLNNLANQHELQLLPYFEMKAQFNQLLEEQKRKVQQLEESVLKIKSGYSEALHNLERISDEIHTRRRLRDQVLSVGDGASNSNSPVVGKKRENECEKQTQIPELRTEGVGSEDPSPLVSEPKCNGEIHKDRYQQHNSLKKPFDLPLQKVSLAEMEEMTPMTPGMLFSPIFENRFAASKEVPKEGQSNLSDSLINQMSFDVPKLSELAKTVAEVGFNEICGERLCTIPRVPSPCYSLGTGISSNSGSGTPLRNANCNILKMNHREELLSDSESLASTDTADTLDDHHIECLLLDKVLEQDYQDILASTSDLVSTP